MKVLFCTNTFEASHHGPSKFARLVYNYFKNNTDSTIEVRIVTEDCKENKAGLYKLDFHCPAYLKPFSQFLRMRAYHQKATEIRKEFNFDLIVYNFGIIGLKSTKQWPTIAFVNDQLLCEARWSNFKPQYTWLKKMVFKQVERKVCKNAKAVIVNSDYLKARIEENYNLPPTKVLRLYKGLQLSNYQYMEERSFGEVTKVLFVKTNFVLGRLDILIQALNQLHYNFELSVIGPPLRYKDNFQDQCNATVQLRFMGPQEATIVQKELQNCDLFCVPSNFEPLGVANLEALASGTPVVSTNAGGIIETTAKGAAAFLAPPNDANALAQAIDQCINNSALRLQKQQKGRTHIQQFDSKFVLQNFIKLLLTINAG